MNTGRESPTAIVALVGRPNVGKSTLFNRLIGQRKAVVEEQPGTTRDRLYGIAEWQGQAFTLVDTGGLDVAAEGELHQAVQRQTHAAIAEADIIVFVVDAQQGITPQDQHVADLLRTTTKPVLVAANKAESQQMHLRTFEFYELGLGEVVSVSALHGMGTGDLLDAICACLPKAVPPEAMAPTEGVPQFALVGRPNVGKSALLNALLGQERAVVSALPGTTRDTIDTHLVYEGTPVTLVDTAGIRRPGHIAQGAESYSVLRALRALARCDVALLVFDAAEGLTAQDIHIAGYAHEAYKGLVVLANKWDLVKGEARGYLQAVQQRLKFMSHAPVITVSAKTGLRIERILPTALQVYRERGRRVQTSELNRTLREWLTTHTLAYRHKELRIYYGTQADVNPPTFVFFVNDPAHVHFSHRRFLENHIRHHFGFDGTAIKLVFQDSHRQQG